jgi:hypothetical protein
MTTNRFTDLAQRAGVHLMLKRDHERLDRLLEELLAALQANARDEAIRLWADFDLGLSGHMDLEERTLIPSFREDDLLEADALLAEHARIRATLAQLGTAVELHQIRAELVEELATVLRAHARHEDAILYRWAEVALDRAARKDLCQRLEGPPRPCPDVSALAREDLTHV